MPAVIFDFDGTIVDSLAGVIKVYEGVRGGSLLTAEQRRVLQNKSLLQIAREMNIPKWKILWLAVWGRRMFQHHMRSVQVHPGMTEIIQKLHGQKVPLYVLSANRTANVRKYLSWHKLDTYFTGIYGGASFLSKARAMDKLVRREGLNAADVWCVGDERVDVRSAHTAGLKVIAVTWGYASAQGLAAVNPDYLVHDSTELQKVLQACLKK
ncbi:HAD hydrolase-like protein [Candidatus Saccharibacteria bacterium]|nr:MAG: HAD hydrolase-like protein [Candidatus Saccharibacteria bacterium]